MRILYINMRTVTVMNTDYIEEVSVNGAISSRKDPAAHTNNTHMSTVICKVIDWPSIGSEYSVCQYCQLAPN